VSDRDHLAEDRARLDALDAIDLEQARPAFDRIAFLVQCFAETPIAQVEILDGDQIWRTGVADGPTLAEPLEESFAARAADGERVLWVEDALRDRRFNSAAAVVGPSAIRFYAGAPIRLSSGVQIGAVSVFDRRVRSFDAYLAARLEDFAAFVAEEWDRLRALKDLKRAVAEASALNQRMVAAERSEQRLRLAAEMAELVVWEANYAENRMVAFGDAIATPRKIDLRRDGRAAIWQAVHPEDRPAVIALWQRYLDTGAPFRTTYRVSQPNGQYVWVASAAEAEWGEDGEIERIVGVLKDIDQERRAERARAEALVAAEAANRARSEFLANMSQGIRAPLDGMMKLARGLGRTELTPPQREMVDLIGATARMLEGVMGDALDLARIESGGLDLRDEPFDLAAILQSTAAMFEAEAERKGLALRVVISPAAQACVLGDATRLRQIVSNLLANAVKFTGQGRVLLQVEAERAADRVRMQLSVAGVGLDEADGERLDRDADPGLAISKSLAEAMGGTLSASSTPGRDAIVTLELNLPCAQASAIAADVEADLACALEQANAPAAAVDAPAAAPAATVRTREPGPDARDRPHLRILLAEDHPTNRKVASLMLEAIGADLTCVEDGEAAVLATERAQYDVILMDMQMPVMGGLTAIDIIRKRELVCRRPRTPILALTASAEAVDIRASAAAGADGHLTKPLSSEKLIAAIEALQSLESAEPSSAEAAGAALG
jgi:signal transduction histidine kinase/ActR/RegA family two-component response regulator